MKRRWESWLTPFKPGTLVLYGVNDWQFVDNSTPGKGRHMSDFPLPRWKEVYWFWVVRPLGKLHGLARRPLGTGRRRDAP